MTEGSNIQVRVSMWFQEGKGQRKVKLKKTKAD